MMNKSGDWFQLSFSIPGSSTTTFLCLRHLVRAGLFVFFWCCWRLLTPCGLLCVERLSFNHLINTRDLFLYSFTRLMLQKQKADWLWSMPVLTIQTVSFLFSFFILWGICSAESSTVKNHQYKASLRIYYLFLHVFVDFISRYFFFALMDWFIYPLVFLSLLWWIHWPSVHEWDVAC